jgi:ribosomal protein L11 methyltransferase
MKKTPLLQVSIATTPAAEDAVVELLTRLLGVPACTYINADTRTPVVSAYCPDRHHLTPEIRRALRSGLDVLRSLRLDPGSGRIITRLVATEDWAESWKRHFKPITIGSRLEIRPGWIKRRPRPGQAVVILDPGLSFGTGNHPTTLFCLQELAARRTDSETQAFWDAGTGSGILAIAAAKLGYSPVNAVDFDPQSVAVARRNATQNRVAGRIHFARRDLSRLPRRAGRRYDLICANLISDLLLDVREALVGRLKPGGALVLAGILAREFAGVRRAYEQTGLKLVRNRPDGEWCSGTLVFPD